MMDDEYETLARMLAEHPGRWQHWPETFPDRESMHARMGMLRDGGVESFRVDAASFEWCVDEFHTVLDERGCLHVEVRCKW